MGLSHNTLANYYDVMFSLVQFHKYSLRELENMIPFERDLYVEMLNDHLEQQNQQRS